jgi:hypothetical protein
MKLCTGRRALRGWMKYHETSRWWMICFQNAKRSERERDSLRTFGWEWNYGLAD